jgi:hypothetical protein
MPTYWILWTAALLSTLAIITTWGLGAWRLYNKNFDWQPKVEQELTGLHAGYNVAFFRQVLGVPILAHATSRGYAEDVFEGRGFWVETLTKGSNEVQFYSVTVCDPSIRPRFYMPNVGVVTLNLSTLSSITSVAQYRYWFTGMQGTDSPSMKEFAYAGASGGYRTFMWGLSSACVDSVNQMGRLETSYPVLDDSKIPIHQLTAIRKRSIANVYGETAPGFQMSDLPNNPEELGVSPVAVDLVTPAHVKRAKGDDMSSCNVASLGLEPSGHPLCGDIFSP